MLRMIARVVLPLSATAFLAACIVVPAPRHAPPAQQVPQPQAAPPAYQAPPPPYSQQAPQERPPIYSERRGPPAQPQGQWQGPPQGQAQAQIEYGQVRNIERLRLRGEPLGAGAVIGGVVGAVVGRSVGSGHDGRAVGTVLGAVGGAIIGNEIERDQAERVGHDVFRISIRLDQGAARVFEVANPGELRVGDRVRIEGGNRLVRV